MSKILYYDEDGNIASEEEKGKGRPPKGATKDENGNFHVHPQEEPEQTMYVTISASGDVTREVKGRGRNRTGYVLMTDGEHKGHYVKDERTITSADVVADADEPVTAE